MRRPHCAEITQAPVLPERQLDARERLVIEKMLQQCSTYAGYPDDRAELAAVIERIGLNMTQAYLHQMSQEV